MYNIDVSCFNMFDIGTTNPSFIHKVWTFKYINSNVDKIIHQQFDWSNNEADIYIWIEMIMNCITLHIYCCIHVNGPNWAWLHI